MKLSKISAAVLAVSISNLSFAETILDDIFVIDNSKIVNNSLQTTYSTQVFTKEDISDSGATDLTGFLNQNTTLQVQPGYGNPMTALIDMNGYGLEAGNSNVQIIVDGISLKNIDSAPVILNFISLNAIAEIAILRGSGSVLYGNGATAGAIVITTVDGYVLPDHAKVSAQLGSNSTSKYTIDLHKGGKIKNYNAFINLNADVFHTDGSIYIENENKKDESNSDNVVLKMGLSNQKTAYLARFSKSSGNTLSPFSIPIADFNAKPDIARENGNSQAFENTQLGLSIHHSLTADSKINYQINHEERSSAYTGNSAYPGSASDFTQTEQKLDFKTRFDSAVLSYGGSVKSAVRDAADQTTRDDSALFASANIQLSKNVLLNAGYRAHNFDYDYKKAGITTSKQSYDLKGYNLGSSWLINQANSVYLNFNHAFNAPNIDWLFNYDGSFNGNNITPMETDTITLGYKYRTDKTDLTAEIFNVKLKDEFFYDTSTSSSPFNGKNTNIDSSTKQGINLSVKQTIKNARIGADYAYVDAKIDEYQESTDYQNNRLPGVSDQTLKLFAEYHFTTDVIPALLDHSFRITHKTSSSLYALSDFDNARDLKPGYKSTDISYKMANKTTTLQWGINNLFNQKNGVYSISNVHTTNFERTFYVRADLTF